MKGVKLKIMFCFFYSYKTQRGACLWHASGALRIFPSIEQHKSHNYFHACMLSIQFSHRNWMPQYET